MTGRTALVALAIGGAALAASAASRAATIDYALYGSVDQQVSSFAPSPPGYFENALSPGSSLTVELDANGDGVAGDVTIVSSYLPLHATYDLGNHGSIMLDQVATLSGGLGHLTHAGGHDSVDWAQPASYSSNGNWTCYGAICSVLQVPEGVPMPYPIVIGPNAFPVAIQTSVELGHWQLTPGLFGSLDSDAFVVARDPTTGAWTEQVILRGFAVAEPAALATLGAALLLLALSRRASGTMRRHEAG